MRVLLLSCNTGEGHNSTAKALMDVLQARGAECVLQDVLEYLSPKFSKFVCNWHVRLYRYGPAIFDSAYRAMERSTADPDETTPVYELMALGADKLYEAIRENDFNGIICVHVFSGMMMTEVRRKWNVKVPCFFVNTDYSCVPFTEQCEMDGYFIPSASLISEFTASGLPKGKLIPYGIPVRQVFYLKKSKKCARDFLRIPQDLFVVLLMCGSMGCGPMKKITRELMERIPAGGLLVTICGRNEKLYKSVSEIDDSRLRVLGYCSNVYDYMDAADLVVTKPGGLSSTEAACKHLPMVLINAVGGCEGKNFELFLQQGYARGSKNPEEIVDIVSKLEKNPTELEKIKEKLTVDFNQNSAEKITDYVMEAAEKYSR